MKGNIENIRIYHAPNILWHYRVPTYNELNKRCKCLDVKYISREKDLLENPDCLWNKGSCFGFHLFNWKVVFNLATISDLTKKYDCYLLEWNLRNLILLPMSFLYRFVLRRKVIWWGHGESKTPSFFTRITLFLGKYIPNAVIVYVDDTKSDLVNREKYCPLKVYVAPNGIDVIAIKKSLRFYEEHSKKENSTFNTLYSGRLNSGRDLERIIYSVASLKKKGINVKHTFIGDGNDRTNLETLTKKLKLENDIIFLGSLHDVNELARYYYNTDLVIIPGWLGLAINQALAYSTPVLICNNEALHNPEVRLYSDNVGWMYDYELNDLSRVLELIINKERLNLKIKGEFGLKLIEDCYSTQKMVDGIEEAVEYAVS